jgi:hypothetical protein
MAIHLAAALSRLVLITCPHCGAKKKVERRPVQYRTCARCHRRFDDPLAARTAKAKKR